MALISLLLSIVPVQDTLRAGTVVALKEPVPLSQVASPVSSIRPELMRATGTYRPNSLSGMVPGLHIPDYGASLTSTIYLRGLGSRMENPVLGLYLEMTLPDTPNNPAQQYVLTDAGRELQAN